MLRYDLLLLCNVNCLAVSSKLNHLPTGTECFGLICKSYYQILVTRFDKHKKKICLISKYIIYTGLYITYVILIKF